MTQPLSQEGQIQGQSADLSKPNISVAQATTIVNSLWKMDVQVNKDTQKHMIRSMPSYDDCNFLLTMEDGKKYVLKISYEGERESNLILQGEMMQHLAARGVLCPKHIASCNGQNIERYTAPDGQHFVRLLTFISGRVQATVPCTHSLLRTVGAFVGNMENALTTFTSPHAHREMAWDLAKLPLIRQYFDAIEVTSRRQLVSECLQEFEGRVLPQMESLRSSVIHNDANDHNVIVSVDSEEIVGVIDFGDVLLTKTVFNPAITIAYSILEADEPVSAGVSLIQGYTAQFPLQDTELSLLFLLTMCRLAQSVVYSTIKMLDYPDDEYIPIAQRPAWRVLESLWGRRAEVSAAWVAAAVRPDTPHLDKQ